MPVTSFVKNTVIADALVMNSGIIFATDIECVVALLCCIDRHYLVQACQG